MNLILLLIHRRESTLIYPKAKKGSYGRILFLLKIKNFFIKIYSLKVIKIYNLYLMNFHTCQKCFYKKKYKSQSNISNLPLNQLRRIFQGLCLRKNLMNKIVNLIQTKFLFQILIEKYGLRIF
ncbi:hypothetical protein TTHERM_000731450 (macronuclear) [Tetrahymena thermophila SB210]|uniref:Uncharacterized protein n=1 Tax=Tetrahymena thermophila (strain SB210) TaxID=312017 RepID=W7X6X0_TETTS|nr:hypothetical protein TTHERM_000731450 [Tetrahymena thermophila SB210]EWS72133.1 hypothetical protein TTHERM_000731450 [Tetrahymena thermophila SB210]|eukprot:XP_012655326.1 hypothetical protein TTHERM_000731450 [Tetrahymena thermophila SB210]